SSTVTTWGATTSQILALREHLLAAKVTCVVIESTSDYWKPFYYLLDDVLNMMLVNASRVRNVPGRKSDVSDAAWLADLGAYGLVTASLVPPPAIRARSDPRPHPHHPGTLTRGIAAGEAARRRRDQTVLGGHRHHRSVGASNARSADRRPDRS